MSQVRKGANLGIGVQSVPATCLQFDCWCFLQQIEWDEGIWDLEGWVWLENSLDILFGPFRTGSSFELHLGEMASHGEILLYTVDATGQAFLQQVFLHWPEH